MKPPFLKFRDVTEFSNPKGKTKVVRVYNHKMEYLGYIHWRSGWRHYIMSYAPSIDMSVSCDDELNKFMHTLEDERKNG